MRFDAVGVVNNVAAASAGDGDADDGDGDADSSTGYHSADYSADCAAD